MSVMKPTLPAGHRYEVEQITYEKARTMLFVWIVPRGPGRGSYHNASVALRPQLWWLGHLLVYCAGRQREARDRKYSRRDQRNALRFEKARTR